MIPIWLTAILTVGASIALGRALMLLLRWSQPSWLSAALGYAALVILAPILVRFPGRGTTAFIAVAVLVLIALYLVRRDLPDRDGAQGEGGSPPSSRAPHLTALVTGVVMLLVASLPFLFNLRTGVLGEGIYTNDHAAQLFWADWLQNGFGPEPAAVAFGYPVGPQALAAALAGGTTFDLESVFNGVLLAIPILTALTALAALTELPPVRRVVAACLTGLPYLAASFLAQSAFKETSMAMFVLALAVALHTGTRRRGVAGEPPPPLGSLAGVVVILGLASVFTFSIPGAAWFAIALGLFLIALYVAGELDINWRAIRDWLSAHRKLLAGAAVLVVGVLALALGPGLDFVSKINDVQQSRGRLSSPVFPGEALGVWPQGDFRVVRGEVSGSLLATAFAAICMAVAAFSCVRRREWALLSVLVAAGVIYLLSRPFSQIHVQAKALCVLAPIATLVAVRGLLMPAAEGSRGSGNPGRIRFALGVLFVVFAAGSTLLALREAPISFDHRADDLEALGKKAKGKPVLFLGLDRFAAYRLRGTHVESPGGYVPPEVQARPEKAWQQGSTIDFDTVKTRKLNEFRYAITTAAAYQSTPPSSFQQVERRGDYVLWKRVGKTPLTAVLNEGGDPGRELQCANGGETAASHLALVRGGRATVLDQPVTLQQGAWDRSFPFDAPGDASVTLDLTPGTWDLSLQYHSQARLRVRAEDATHDEPPSLDGFYLSGAGRGAFWPAGTVHVARGGGPVKVTVSAEQPSGLQRALGVDRKVWLGEIAATRRVKRPRITTVKGACGQYLDHYVPHAGVPKSGAKSGG